MPLPIAHSLLGASIVALIYPKTEKRIWLPLSIGAILANAADFDFALVFLLGSKDLHRGFSHSILFAVIVSLLILFAYKFKRIKESSAFSLAFASHFLLDFTTTKIGDGIELFWFFNRERFGLRWFSLSEYPSKMSATELITTIIVEMIMFTLILLTTLYFRKKYHEKSNPNEQRLFL
jgi:inner membrane protein